MILLDIEHSTYENLSRRQKERWKRSQRPPWSRVVDRDVVDVDYMEICDSGITDPAYLLPEHSMTPLHIEQRRREDMHNGIVSLINDIADRIAEFGRNGLHNPSGVGRSPFEWEQLLYDKIQGAFVDLADEILMALSKFKSEAVVESWILAEGFGYNEDKILRFIQDRKKDLLVNICREAFIYDALHVRYSSPPDDDLPF